MADETEHSNHHPLFHRTYVFEKQGASAAQDSTTSISIKPVTTFSMFKTFYRVPFLVYRDDPYWVAPFWREVNDFFRTENPFWSHADCVLYIAVKNDEFVGRIAAIIDHSFCEATKTQTGYFGFFECIEDLEVASALWRAAESWLRLNGMTSMRGPIDGRVDIGCGFLATGFQHRPCLLSSYSPPYYVSFAERYGMIKVRDFFDYYVDLTRSIPDQLKQRADDCAASGVKIRRFRRLRTGTELRWWVPLFLETFSDHWGFVPVSPEEVTTRFGVKQLRWTVDPRLFLIAEVEGEPVAYLWATPDYNQLFQSMDGRLGPVQYLQVLIGMRRITTGKLHFIGIKNACRHRHVASYLNYAALMEMQRRGYQGAEVGMIDEMNPHAHQTIAITGATRYKTHRVFEKSLQPSEASTSSETVRRP
ncbi:MAG TPA: hypothetical protein VMT57_03840 [Candidatus Thermoplasmatota archaeon]|nr:hypothetical protein [Candidatus Thermoplasmatota archaeon]